MATAQKVAVITGASQGIGAALVDAYLDRNYRVVATSRSIQPSSNPDVLTITGDIGDPTTGPRVIAEALERFGRIDTLVNNAGIFVASPFTGYTAEQYAQVVATNLNGFYFITQAAVAEMEKQGRGHVVSITTSLVDHPLSKVPSVLASLTKGGIVAATKSLAVEYAARGLRFNAVSPGIIKTPMHAPETHDFLGKLHPMGHMGEIVGAILYLENAGFVTGEILHVDGGQAAGH
jgi:NAD(P)-dependent dehydrogenase (short-subunit alcohol dehydrogenase family)